MEKNNALAVLGLIIGAIAGGVPGAIIGGVAGSVLGELVKCPVCGEMMNLISGKWKCPKCGHETKGN
ncbi:MAG: hypothetical protein KGH55_03460 [Nanoarchaeota archaeon]|nr:hypothetical protein [Nanoarchaeota archaeon]